MEITICNDCLTKYKKYVESVEKGHKICLNKLKEFHMCPTCYGLICNWIYFSNRECRNICRNLEPATVYFDRVVGYRFRKEWS
jgi:hypothetical protein